MPRRVPPYEAGGGATPACRNALRRAGTGFSPWGLHLIPGAIQGIFYPSTDQDWRMDCLALFVFIGLFLSTRRVRFGSTSIRRSHSFLIDFKDISTMVSLAQKLLLIA